MKLIYIANTRLPTEMAHGLQIMKMCEAFSKLKIKSQKLKVELIVPMRFSTFQLIGKDPFEYYKTEKIFKIRKIFSFDLTPLNRFLGPVSFLIQAFSFSFFTFIYLFFKKADIVYSRDRFSLFFTSFVKKNLIFEVHKIHKICFWGILKRVKKIIVISSGLKDVLLRQGIKEDKILVAPDGIDLEDFESVETDICKLSSPSRNVQINADWIKKECRKKIDLPIEKKLVVYTGHLYKWKGIETLALASRYLPNDTLVVIIGGIKWYLSNFKKFVKKKGLKKIRILGHQDYFKISYFLKSADCLVLTGTKKLEVSRRYTSPMKMFEYMASKRPIIASDLPSFREVLNQNNAVLVEPDNPRALAEGVKRVLENPDLAKRISEQAYKDVQKYTWERRAKKIIKFIGLLRKN